MTESSRWLSLFVCVGVALGAGCKSQPEINPYEVTDETGGEDLLDEEVSDEEKQTSRKQTEWGGQIEFSLPDPPKELSKKVDGEFDDWEGSKFKTFRSSEHIIEGDHFWDGGSDTGVRVAASSDKGHIYFAVEVDDDTVIDAGSADPFADGVVLWLRDPGLAALREDLPEAVEARSNIHTDIGILFTPDGQFWRRDKGPMKLYREGIEAATVKTKSGYRVELALKVGVLRQASTFPTPEVAFRVEVIDGDEVKRRGEQTHLSTMPPLEDGNARYALLDLEGWLPYASLAGQPPRNDALGRWKLGEEGWTFDAFEVAPDNWRLLSGDAGVEKAMRKQEVFREVCSEATTDTRLVEAYQSRNGRHRVALILCGTRPTDGTCPADAETRVFWAHLKASGQSWTLSRAVSVTKESLEQCPGSAPSGADYYTSFSFIPLGMIGSPVWAVGWHKRRDAGSQRFHQSGIWVLNTLKSAPKVGQAQTYRKLSKPRSRELSRSKVYLTAVDNKQGLDICEVETIKDQNCRGIDRKCTTPQRGQEVITHIRMWNPQDEKFERYMMSKHRNCSADFNFAERDAYLLFHRNDRLGIIRSPAK